MLLKQVRKLSVGIVQPTGKYFYKYSIICSLISPTKSILK